MNLDPSLWSYFANASLVVKIVMLLLAAASVASWTIIFQRAAFLKKLQQASQSFEERFWQGISPKTLQQHNRQYRKAATGLGAIFHAGYTAYCQLLEPGEGKKRAAIESHRQDSLLMQVDRAMHVANAKEQDMLDNHLSFLATVGSISPYIGLFGTVWGIMSAFHALGHASQATISMVAPGIAEALVATAMGLFAAIPAVVAYNRFTHRVERLTNQYDLFQTAFCNYLYHDVQAQHNQHPYSTSTTTADSV